MKLKAVIIFEQGKETVNNEEEMMFKGEKERSPIKSSGMNLSDFVSKSKNAALSTRS